MSARLPGECRPLVPGVVPTGLRHRVAASACGAAWVVTGRLEAKAPLDEPCVELVLAALGVLPALRAARTDATAHLVRREPGCAPRGERIQHGSVVVLIALPPFPSLHVGGAVLVADRRTPAVASAFALEPGVCVRGAFAWSALALEAEPLIAAVVRFDAIDPATALIRITHRPGPVPEQPLAGLVALAERIAPAASLAALPERVAAAAAAAAGLDPECGERIAPAAAAACLALAVARAGEPLDGAFEDRISALIGREAASLALLAASVDPAASDRAQAEASEGRVPAGGWTLARRAPAGRAGIAPVVVDEAGLADLLAVASAVALAADPARVLGPGVDRG